MAPVWCLILFGVVAVRAAGSSNRHHEIDLVTADSVHALAGLAIADPAPMHKTWRSRAMVICREELQKQVRGRPAIGLFISPPQCRACRFPMRLKSPLRRAARLRTASSSLFATSWTQRTPTRAHRCCLFQLANRSDVQKGPGVAAEAVLCHFPGPLPPSRGACCC